MAGRAGRWAGRAFRRLRRIERREVDDLRDWLENTRNVLHLTTLVVLPLVLALVTYLANATDLLPFLLFPPLASGAHTLFAHPESRYASPRRFVGGLTTGAICGWIALEATAYFRYGVPPESFEVDPGAAAVAVFLTGAVTWALDIEESSAFSTALLVLVTGTARPAYVLSVGLSTGVIAAIFVLWRRHFYEQRARYLYQSTKGDDHVLVPMRGEHAGGTAMLGARLAGAHDAGKVVLLDVVADGTAAEEWLGEEVASGMERRAERIEASVGVPCEVIVAADGGDLAGTVLEAAKSANCDLIVAPFGGQGGRLSPFSRNLLAGDVDVLLHRSEDGRETWRSVMVPVRKAGDVAHAMIDFALRLADDGGVSVCHCIDSERERRVAEGMLANLVETVSSGVETRVARESIDAYLERTAGGYDLVIVGASRDRSAASRFVAPPTFRRLADVDSDVAIVHRG